MWSEAVWYLTLLTVCSTGEVSDSRVVFTTQEKDFSKYLCLGRFVYTPVNKQTNRRIISFPSRNSAVKLWEAGLVDIFILACLVSSFTLFLLVFSQQVCPSNPRALSPSSPCLLQAQK